jgi:hypothetical protein
MDGEFLERCIMILNEMALDPEIYPRQEYPVVILFPDECCTEKHNALVADLGLDAEKIETEIYNLIFYFKNGIVYPGSDEYTYADAETKVRSEFQAYFRELSMYNDDLIRDGYTPRFTVALLRQGNYISSDGMYICIESYVANEKNESESMVQ